MTSPEEKIRRYLFPTYEESLEDLEHSQALGKETLQKHGFAIGDLVYLDGKLKGVIVDALSDIYGHIPNLSIRVKTTGQDAFEYTGITHYKNNEWVVFPCTIDNITKEQKND